MSKDVQRQYCRCHCQYVRSESKAYSQREIWLRSVCDELREYGYRERFCARARHRCHLDGN